NVAVLLGRQALPLVHQAFQGGNDLRTRVGGLDDVVDVAERRGDVGIGELLVVLGDQAGPFGGRFFRLVGFLLVQDVDGTLGAHDGQLGTGPRHVVVGADVLGAHDVVRAAVGLARDHGDLGHGGFAVRVEQLGAVLDDAAPFLLRAGEKSGHILEGDERNIEG